jgi:hypothetical protein
MKLFLREDGYKTGLIKLIKRVKFKDIENSEFKEIYLSRLK